MKALRAGLIWAEFFPSSSGHAHPSATAEPNATISPSGQRTQDTAKRLFRGTLFQALQIIERVKETMHLALLMTAFLAFVVSIA